MFLKAFVILVFLPCLQAIAQQENSYNLWKDDTVLRNKYYEESMRKKQVLLSACPKIYEKDYKAIYEHQFDEIGELWKDSRAVTATEINGYLQAIVKNITSANPQLRGVDARVVFTRDGWPNAVSLGDGSIAINGGLFIFLNNEAELAFVICHELSHYYLDHTNKSIKKIVDLYNSEDFKKEVKRLSKQEYGAGREYDELMKKMAFGGRRHSRENEAEADRQAFLFLKNTGFSCDGIISCLQLLDNIDDSSIYKPLALEAALSFDEYPFKKRWIQKESVLFGAMTEEYASGFTKQEKDSLKTHPDCLQRIALLKDSVAKTRAGKTFLVDESLFRKIKKDFLPEITEQEFREDNLTLNLYNSLLMLQNGAFTSFSVYNIARDLNILFQRQRDHKLGHIERENRTYRADYNLVLRMIDRLKLDELAAINYYFCKKYESQMTGYPEFAKEKQAAQNNFSHYSSN
jgi:Zn-dependent protease with chaperone function